MNWRFTLEAAATDVEFLTGAEIEGLSAVEGEPRHCVLAIDHPEGVPETEEGDLVYEEAQAFVTRLNGLGRLRWGKRFEGVSIVHSETVDSAGAVTQRVYVDAARGFMSPQEFADFVEKLGHPRPPLPVGLEHIDGLDLDAALDAAASNPAAARILQLISSMLEDDDGINWGSAYTALETIEHELHRQGVDGKALGWWTKNEREDFKATANSPEALGIRARHGKPTGLAEARMESSDANYFVRRVAALWLASPYAKLPPETDGSRG